MKRGERVRFRPRHGLCGAICAARPERDGAVWRGGLCGSGKGGVCGLRGRGLCGSCRAGRRGLFGVACVACSGWLVQPVRRGLRGLFGLVRVICRGPSGMGCALLLPSAPCDRRLRLLPSSSLAALVFRRGCGAGFWGLGSRRLSVALPGRILCIFSWSLRPAYAAALQEAYIGPTYWFIKNNNLTNRFRYIIFANENKKYDKNIL